MAEKDCNPKNIKAILVATDGSEFSAGAVREAIMLAKGSGASLTALSVVEFNPEFDALAPGIEEKIEVQAQASSAAICGLADKESIKCETVTLRSAHPCTTIVDEANRRGVDLIVMGRRGRRGIARLMMGSATARVIGHSPINVLVVPKNAKVEGKLVLIATDGSAYSDRAACDGIAIAKSLGASVLVVSVVDGEEQKAKDNVDKITRSAESLGVKAEGLVEHGRPFEAIVKAAKDKKASLIVMGSYGKTGLERLLMGSVTERVIGLTDSAVFVAATK